MLSRRSLLASAAAVPLVSARAFATTPPGVIVMAKTIDDIVSFDPARAYAWSDIEACANIYRKLVAPKLTNLAEIGPDLATSWDVSPDGRTFTFHLGADAHFASGKPVTAEDAAFSLHRVVALDLTPGFIITQFGFTKENVEKLIRATDAETLVLELPKPAATSFVLYCLSASVGGIVEKAEAMRHQKTDDLGHEWLTSHSAGSGPYRLTSWAAADHVILDANPHSRVPVETKRIFIRDVKDPGTQLLMLRRGDADIARDLTADLLATAAKDPALGTIAVPSTNQMFLAANEAVAPFAKSGVRQALKWAIDYAGIQKNITPETYIINQAFEPSMMPGALATNPFRKDPAKAKALLAEAGYPAGFHVTLDHFSEHPYSDIAAAIQADLGAVGIKVSLLPGTRKQVFTKMIARRHELIISEWFPDYFDPNSNAQAFCANPDDSDHSPLKIIAWRCHFINPELTREVAEAARERDTEKRIALYHKMQREFWETAPIAFLLQENATAALRKGVTGFQLGPQSDFTRYDTIKKA